MQTPADAGTRTSGSPKLDARLRLLLRLGRDTLVHRKREDDRRLRAEADRLAALARRMRDEKDSTSESSSAAATGTARLPALPVPLTFGLYLPEVNLEEMTRLTHLRAAFVSATVRAEASARDLASLGLHVRNQAGSIFTAYVPLDACDRLAASSAVDYVELARPLESQLEAVIPLAGISQIQLGGTEGAGVIVGVIDSGLDFYHEHFRDGAGASRVLRTWDQTLSPQQGESGPAGLPGFNPLGGPVYGVEYTQAQIDAELASPPPAYTIVRSNPGTEAHGTMVTSCAAGSGHVDAYGNRAYLGAAPQAEIIHVNTGNLANNQVFADSTNVLDAFAYIFAHAAQLAKPCVVNLSQSDTLGGHDGTTNGERFLDSLPLVPGRAIVCSAGNQNTFGLRTQGAVTQGATTVVKLVYDSLILLPSYDDCIQIWYDGHDEIAVTLTVPTAPVPTVIGPVVPGSYSEATLANGISVVVDSSLYANNGDHLIQIQITNVSLAAPIPLGEWLLALDGTLIINGTFDAWVDRGNRWSATWQDPIFDKGTIGVPATGRRVISVGAHVLDGGVCGANPTPTIDDDSGCGPTRDGRVKPEIAAPGVVSVAMSRDMNQPLPPGYPLTTEEGTSVAAPIVAGAVALLFECRGGGLTSGDVKQLLTDFAAPNVTVPHNAFGLGSLCMEGICAAPVPDVDTWIKDATDDDGVEPYTGAVAWLSPDIVVLDAAGNPVPNPTHDPANLWNNLVDVTVRNRGSRMARNLEVFLYSADPATNLPFPAEWKSQGFYTAILDGAGQPVFVQQGNTIVVQQLRAGAEVTVRFAWAPPTPGTNIRGDDHFCLIARVEQGSDPSNVNAGGWPVIRGSNNIALRNLHVIDASSGSASSGCYAIGSLDHDTLEVFSQDLEGDLELVLPTQALPWRELALLEKLPGPRLRYGAPGGLDATANIRRVLESDAVPRILDVSGAAHARVEGAATRLSARLGGPPLYLSDVRIQPGVKMPVRLWLRGLRLGADAPRLHVAQRSGGKIIGGVSVELRRNLARPKEYDVRRQGDGVVVTPRSEAQGSRRPSR